MAKYELPIYGENDAIEKKYESNHCAWGVYLQAADMQETLEDKPAREKMEAVGEILKMVFIGITDDELLRADGVDVLNTFRQIVAGGQKIKSGKNA